MNEIISYCRIVPGRVLLNGEVYFESDGKRYVMHDFLSAVYETLDAGYRRFYRMDALSKLGFLASELILGGRMDREKPKETVGIAFFNRSASLEADDRYRQTIRDKDHFFPSPADFVYTLPNIVTGEIAIRNKIHGETAFHVMPRFRGDRLCEAIDDMMRYGGMNDVLGGWTEVTMDAGLLSCLMVWCRAGGGAAMPLTGERLDQLYDSC
jgi:hypothetical protein